ncbi:hypothetical protein N752_07660 [Desulforamulus aquiferis]|nr:hypothetical protein [Desulforamulus aquiferis]RYD05760.1 hypothetical protein N752_07660 [Desulforamulus aquiferis]
MSKITFTAEQVVILKENQYVKAASEKSITYTDEYKRHFVSESFRGSIRSKSSRKPALPLKSWAKSASRRSLRNGVNVTAKKECFP